MTNSYDHQPRDLDSPPSGYDRGVPAIGDPGIAAILKTDVITAGIQFQAALQAMANYYADCARQIDSLTSKIENTK